MRFKRSNESKLFKIQYNDVRVNKPNSKYELEYALASLKDSSADADNIPVAFLKYLPEVAIECLLCMYNIIWTKQKFPEIWRSVILILNPKINKPPESHRPISLTCAMCKSINF